MKSSILFLLFLYSFFVGYSQKTELERDGLKGLVKSITLYRYSQDSGEERQFQGKSYNSYNEKGNLLEYSSFENENGPKNFTILAYYDSKGKRIFDSSFNEGRVYNGKSVYDYDKSGDRILWVRYDNADSILEKHNFQYNSNHLLTTHTFYDSRGKLLLIKYTYDKKENKLNETVTGTEVNLGYQFNYIYDAVGNRITEHYQNPNTKIEFRTKMGYNADRNIITLERFSIDENVEYRSSISYKFDKYNNWIEKSQTTTHYYNNTSYETYEMEIREIKYY